jgi:hypothetical protein
MDAESKTQIDDARIMLTELDAATLEVRAQLDAVERAQRDGNASGAASDQERIAEAVENMGHSFVSMGHGLLDVAGKLWPKGRES